MFRWIRKLGSSSRFQYTLRDSRHRTVFLAVIVIPTAYLAFQGGWQGLTATLAESRSAGTIRRVLELDPHNAELQHRLGLLRLYGLRGANTSEGVDLLREAAKLAPSRPFYWSDLASGCKALQDVRCSDSALQRALWLSPMTPLIHWQAANYYASYGQTALAEKQLRELLAIDPLPYAASAFNLCAELHLTPQTVVDTVVPEDKPAGVMIAYAERLAADESFESAAQVWDETGRGKAPIPFSLAESYLHALLNARQFSLAWQAWNDLETRGGVETRGAISPGNLVFNGGFENAPLNGGFDWTFGQEAYLTLDFGAPGAYRGSSCLQVDFTVGRNDDFEPVYQYVAVSPGAQYLLEAYVRSAGITSDSGPRLRVIDPVDPGRLALATGTTVGTTAWHPIRLTFSTGPDTSFIRLSIWRPRSRSFPMEISGTFWLDAVSLRRLPSA